LRLEFFFNLFGAMHLIAQLANLLLQPSGLRFKLRWLRPVSRLQCTQVALDALLNLLLPLIDLASREVTVTSARCPELASINSNKCL
jgi:hypothetical protein